MTDALRQVVLNFGQWVRDHGLLRVLHSRVQDRLNRFEEIGAPKPPA